MTENQEPEQVDFSFELSEREISFVVDEQLYELDAVYGAAYLFVDRCYVFLTRPADHKVGVRLRSKEPSDEATLEALAGEFANELLNSQLRVRIGKSTAAIREQYMARAFFAERPSSTISELLAELDAEELEEEPLEIAVPWETTDKPGAAAGEPSAERGKDG
jgi:His-Xaa-Ser system protein HxsD